MLKYREHIRFLNIDAWIFLFVLLFGLLVYNNSVRNKDGAQTRSASVILSTSKNYAISCSYIRVQVFQKICISNKDNFKLLAFNRNPLIESKKSGIAISNFQRIRQGSLKIPHFILRYHLFPSETDDPTFLS
jgi:hypothetical protein